MCHSYDPVQFLLILETYDSSLPNRGCIFPTFHHRIVGTGHYLSPGVGWSGAFQLNIFGSLPLSVKTVIIPEPPSLFRNIFKTPPLTT